MKVSVIIPCHPPHIPKLGECFKNIINQTILPIEVILAVSQTSDSIKNVLINQHSPTFLSKGIKFFVENTLDQKFAGQNRNRGARVAHGDIFMFIDADDQISKYKIELTLKYMTLYNADMLMHTFAYFPSDATFHQTFDKPLEDVMKEIVVHDATTIKKMVFGTPPVRNRQKELKSIKRLCRGFPPGITMGYATIKRAVFNKIKYSDRPRGEDTLFFKDCVWANFKTIMITCRLINYKPSSSASPQIPVIISRPKQSLQKKK